MNSPIRSWLLGLILIGGLVGFAPHVSANQLAETNRPALSAPAGEVFKMYQAGVQEEVLLAYVANSTNQFTLTADDLIFLHANGAPAVVTTAMLKRDQELVAASVPPTLQTNLAPAVAAVPNLTAAAAPPAIDPSKPAAAQFYEALMPYGTWFQFPQSQWAWQPHEAATNAAWRPYVDGGRWSWTDQGWNWESDYPWGWAAFHYGRWSQDDKLGWIWFPDTVWAPSWVTWRQYDDYVGWAPLPPNALTDTTVVEQPVINSYDYGVPQHYYTFVNFDYVFLPDIRSRCVPSYRVREFYPHCRVVNHYAPGKYYHGVVNKGVDIGRVSKATGRHFASVPDYRRTHRQHLPSPHYNAQQPTTSFALPASPRLPAAPGSRTVRTEGTILPAPNPSIGPINPIVPPVSSPPVRETRHSFAAPANPVAETPRPPGNHFPLPQHGGGNGQNYSGPRPTINFPTPAPASATPAPAPTRAYVPPTRPGAPVQPVAPNRGPVAAGVMMNKNVPSISHSVAPRVAAPVAQQAAAKNWAIATAQKSAPSAPVKSAQPSPVFRKGKGD